MAYTPDPKLVFRRPASGSPSLVFNESEFLGPSYPASLDATLPGLQFVAQVAATSKRVTFTGVLPALDLEVHASSAFKLSFTATLPGLQFEAHVVRPRDLVMDATLPGLQFELAADWDINVARPTVSNARGQFQRGLGAQTPARALHQQAARSGSQVSQPITGAGHTDAAAGATTVTALRTRSLGALTHDEGLPRRRGAGATHQDCSRTRLSGGLAHDEGLPLRAGWRAAHQDRLRVPRPGTRDLMQQAAPLRRGMRQIAQGGQAVRAGRLVPNQQARKPPGGVWVWPPKPPADPCYLPDPKLVFKAAADGSTRLVFICERHRPTPPGTVVVPTLLEYIVTNNVTLMRLADSRMLRINAATLRLDADSWTWGSDLSLPGSMLPYLEWGEAYELTVNGTPFRLVLDKWNQTRTFGSAAIKATARGLGAELSDPFAPVLNFGVPTPLTAQQVAYNCLTDNGVPIGWDLDWQLTDWDVPAGAWAMQGTYIQALQQIAQAAGGYLQPHNTLRTIHVLPRYPTAPWDWAGVTPDFLLPESVVSVEGTEWLEKAAYNAVVVQGERGGIRGMVKRAGSAGDFHAPMVTDKLITGIAAARQRGIAVLGEGGQRSEVSLRMPVLAETGIIKPGKFISYQGAKGIVRSVAVEASFPETWQTVGVEFRG